MKARILQIIFILVVFVGLMSSQKIWYRFFAKSRLYDARYNAERAKRGILPLPANWITHDKTKESRTWFPPDKDTTASVFRSMKMVLVKDGEIKEEYDDIAKRRNGKYDVLEIYSYYDSAYSKVFIYNNQERDDTISKPQADSILQSWNFKLY